MTGCGRKTDKQHRAGGGPEYGQADLSGSHKQWRYRNHENGALTRKLTTQKWPGKTQFCFSIPPFHSLFTWGSYFTFLKFSFFITKLDYKIAPTANGIVRVKWENSDNTLSIVPDAHSFFKKTYLSLIIINIINNNRNKLNVKKIKRHKRKRKSSTQDRQGSEVAEQVLESQNTENLEII